MSDNKTVTFSGNGYEATIEIGRATVLQGMTRTRLSLEAQSIKSDFEHNFLRSVTYPALIAGAVKGEIKFNCEALPYPPDFDTFLSLPEELGMQWENAIYELNPHWLPRLANEEQEKKVTQPSTGP